MDANQGSLISEAKVGIFSIVILLVSTIAVLAQNCVSQGNPLFGNFRPCLNPQYIQQQREQQQAIQRRAEAEKEQLLMNPALTLGPDDQDAYYAKLANFITQNKAMIAAIKATNMADAAQICTHLLDNSDKCSSILNNGNQTGTLTSFQLNALGQELDDYVKTNFMWTDNTQLNNWRCNVVDVSLCRRHH